MCWWCVYVCYVYVYVYMCMCICVCVCGVFVSVDNFARLSNMPRPLQVVYDIYNLLNANADTIADDVIATFNSKVC